MHPFFTFLGRRIPAYGLMITLAGLVGVGLSLLLAKRRKYPLDDQLFAELFAIAGVIAGGVVLHAVTMLPYIVAHAGEIFESIESFATRFPFGVVFYGGLIGGVLGGFFYFRRFKADATKVLECAAPAIPLAHSVGRIGCFLAGCCYGRPTNAPWGVVYPPASLAAPPGVPLIPVPLLEAGLNALLGAGLFFYVWKRPGRGSRVFGCYLAAYAIERFCLEFLRGDLIRGALLGLSTSQLISLLLLPAGLLFMFPIRRGKPAT